MIEDFVNDLQELMSYKKKYEFAQKDKQTMSDELFKFMIKEYNNTTYSERASFHIKEICSGCRFNENCVLQESFPENILEPIKSDRAWIPGKVTCKEFRWD
jgi:hypothetical protein